jgi:hypothetical protein
MIGFAQSRIAAATGALVLGLTLVACSGAPAATPGTATDAPVTATPAAPGDTTPPDGGATGTECASVPTLDINNPEMGFSKDPELEAIFPATIGGMPVTDIESFRWVEFLCMFGGQAMVDQMTSAVDSPLNFAALSMATANATVDGEEVQIAAIRFPGQGASNFLTDLAQLVQMFGGSVADMEGSVTNATIGGKTVQVFSSSDGEVAYLYVIGDSLIVLSEMTEAEAATVLGELP